MCCGNLVTGAVGVARATLAQTTGIGAADEATRKARLDICRACPESTKNIDPKYRKFNGLTTLSTCHQCGCLLREKVWIAAENCPAGKW